ncbi:60S ribosomal protein L6 [Purpureocillium lavendulum]|uniref:60S ribosomal protein L6 n=1 Tax=Purpureocillium lavendulum TaxID=1247861 RepID=A0AB34FET4_9HYPO|nr:60S ribosomal protein L6 [Purpureocillium lavendulum]
MVAKEEAANRAVEKLKQITSKIEETIDTTAVPELSSWKILADSIVLDKDSFQYLVGTGGDTGAGKSSLLNALVSKTADITPASQNGACTAAVCCFSYPKSSINPKRFSANIHLKSKETMDQELTEFFQELSEFEHRAETEGGEDSVTRGERAKFNDQIQLIRDWSGLSEQQLQDFGHNNLAQEITSNCQGCDLVFNLLHPQKGVVIEVSSDTELEFRLALKPYVGSCRGNAELLRWPLVEMVEVFVEADILRDGIVLVDLPGEMDALDARSQVARKYYSRLDRLMVVAPGDSAKTSKTAKDLIREDQVVDMEADGMLDDNNLGIIVTKIDQMKWKYFMESEWPYKEIPDDLTQAKDSLEQNELAQQHLKELVRRLKMEIELGESERCDAAAQLKSAKERKRQISGQIQQLNAHCLRACIEARSADIKTVFQEHVDETRQGMWQGADRNRSTILPVFPKALNNARAFEGHIQRRVKRYTQSVCESRQLPDEFRTSFRSYAYKIENFTGEYRSKIRASFSQYRVAVGQIRLSSRDQLTEHMKDGYLAAQKITGKNKKKNQAATMQRHAEQVKDIIFRTTSLKVDGDVRKQRLNLNKALKGHADTLLRHLRKLEDDLVEKAFSAGALLTDVSRTAEIEHLQEEVACDVEEWMTSWAALKVQLPEQEMHDDDHDIALGVHVGDNESASGDQFRNDPDQTTQKVVQSTNMAPLKRAATSCGDESRKIQKGHQPGFHSTSASYSGATQLLPRSRLPWLGSSDMVTAYSANVLEPQTKTTGERQLTTINPTYGSEMPHETGSGGTGFATTQWQDSDDWGFRGIAADPALGQSGYDAFAVRNTNAQVCWATNNSTYIDRDARSGPGT